MTHLLSCLVICCCCCCSCCLYHNRNATTSFTTLHILKRQTRRCILIHIHIYIYIYLTACCCCECGYLQITHTHSQTYTRTQTLSLCAVDKNLVQHSSLECHPSGTFGLGHDDPSSFQLLHLHACASTPRPVDSVYGSTQKCQIHSLNHSLALPLCATHSRSLPLTQALT